MGWLVAALLGLFVVGQIQGGNIKIGGVGKTPLNPGSAPAPWAKSGGGPIVINPTGWDFQRAGGSGGGSTTISTSGHSFVRLGHGNV